MANYALQGEVQLKGQITVSGAKNAALPVLAAALLCRGTSVIHSVPELSDIKKLLAIISSLGAEVSFKQGTVVINADNISASSISAAAMRELRASVLLLGVLLARLRQASVAYPGGCSIGQRPIDLHLQAFRTLGAEIAEQDGVIRAEAGALRGARVRFAFPSVGATENALLLAAAAEGVTLIENAAREPEIADMAAFLNASGAVVRGAGTATIAVFGGRRLTGCEHTVMPDRIEAGTFLLAGLITGGEVWLENARAEHLRAFLAKLRAMGAELSVQKGRIGLRSLSCCKAVDIMTQPYPGFPTDLQALLMAALTVAVGTSHVTETIFENRFQHAAQLNRMGADICVNGRCAVVRGVSRLTGASVEAPDLRAGAALVLAGLRAEGTTIISNISHIERGYERIDEKLRSLGAIINRQA